MRINKKEIPGNTRSLHAINYKKILTKSTDVNILKKENVDFVKNLAYKMAKTCLNDGGVGLAAPQLGIPKKVIVIKEFMNENMWDSYTENFLVFINPKLIVNQDSEEWTFDESCLSVPGKTLPIKRKSEIIVQYWELIEDDFAFKEEKMEGYLARVFLHEYDHLLGISIIDRFKKQK